VAAVGDGPAVRPAPGWVVGQVTFAGDGVGRALVPVGSGSSCGRVPPLVSGVGLTRAGVGLC